MRIIKRAVLVRFWDRHPDAKAGLEAWYGVVHKARWTTPMEMQPVYGNAILLDYLEGGASLDEFLEQYPGVNRETAIAALEEANSALFTRLAKRTLC
ncbi:MAG: HigB toxin, RelE-like toxic component of a toxin-antitoxin system [Acidobacteriaceae bacterium]|jgi:hypothetical protein|nr:HigB toxin, RelE-like toxic component of a toxin-antitoxin system [Acidobacteriaceae bacterium]